MSEAAASTSINPNVPVGAEASKESKANSSVSFDDASELEDAPKSKPKLVKDAPKEKKTETKARGDNKEEGHDFGDAKDDRPEPKKAEKGDKEAGKADPAKPAKAKVYKVKHGETELSLPGDLPIPVTIDGKEEETTFQELLNNHSGRSHLERSYRTFQKEKGEFTRQQDELNTLVSNLYEKSQQDPEAAYDFLAEMTKQDPAKLKIGILRKQFEEMMPLFEMDEESRERFFKERELDFRDKAHANREKSDKDREAQRAAHGKRAETAEKFGIDAEGWQRAETLVKKHLKDVDPKFDGNVTHEQVVWADRNLMALEVIGKSVPHLENHEKFDSIVGDIVHDLMRHPEMNREKLGKLLEETFPAEDKKGLKDLARKAAKTADATGETPRSTSKSKNEPLTFDDI